MNDSLLLVIDYLGTFAFAISGAVAAQQKRMDIFGIVVAAFTTACAGGVIRDVCIATLPPAGLSQLPYLIVTLSAVVFTLLTLKLIDKLLYPVLFFDAIGLSFFAVFGAHKTFTFTGNIEMSILMGMTSAVGGGVLRDVLLNRVPIILHKEIYATAALLAASIQVFGEWAHWPIALTSSLAAGSCLILRLLSLRLGWRLPSFHSRKNNP